MQHSGRSGTFRCNILFINPVGCTSTTHCTFSGIHLAGVFYRAHDLSQRNRPLIVTVNSTKDYGHSPNNRTNPLDRKPTRWKGTSLLLVGRDHH